jgi:hypothetical protein
MKLNFPECRGQATTEYAIVLAFTAVILVLSTLGDPSPMQMLADALKSFYSAYSYAISVSP